MLSGLQGQEVVALNIKIMRLVILVSVLLIVKHAVASEISVMYWPGNPVNDISVTLRRIANKSHLDKIMKSNPHDPLGALPVEIIDHSEGNAFFYTKNSKGEVALIKIRGTNLEATQFVIRTDLNDLEFFLRPTYSHQWKKWVNSESSIDALNPDDWLMGIVSERSLDFFNDLWSIAKDNNARQRLNHDLSKIVANKSSFFSIDVSELRLLLGLARVEQTDVNDFAKEYWDCRRIWRLTTFGDFAIPDEVSEEVLKDIQSKKLNLKNYCAGESCNLFERLFNVDWESMNPATTQTTIPKSYVMKDETGIIEFRVLDSVTADELLLVQGYIESDCCRFNAWGVFKQHSNKLRCTYCCPITFALP